MDLVEPRAQPLGEASGVGEDDRRAVRLDEVEDALLDVRPDAGAFGLGRGGSVHLAGGRTHLGHVLDRHDDLDVEDLGRGRLDDLDVAGAGEAAGDLVDGRTVADRPIRRAGLLEQRVEALEAEREVGAALGAGDRVDLVDDDGLDAAQRVAGLRGEDAGTATRAS